jgi:hypothetical protein
MDSSNPSPQLKSLQAWIKSWEALDADAVKARMADGYQHHFLPSSIGPEGGAPPLSKEDFGQHIDLMLNVIFENLTVRTCFANCRCGEADRSLPA